MRRTTRRRGTSRVTKVAKENTHRERKDFGRKPMKCVVELVDAKPGERIKIIVSVPPEIRNIADILQAAAEKLRAWS